MKFHVLKIFIIFVLIISFPAYAFAPAVIGAITYAGSFVTGVRTAVRLIQNYGLKTGAFRIDAQGRIVSGALAIPQGSQNGVKLDLTTTVPAIRDTISLAPTQYPAIVNNLVNGSGGGVTPFDPDYPDTLDGLSGLQPGDLYYNIKNDVLCRTIKVECNSPNACWRPLGEFVVTACNARYNNNCGDRDCGGTGSAGRLVIQGSRFSFSDLDLSKFSDDDLRRAMSANNNTISETIAAQGETYRRLHGLEQTSYPSVSSPAHYSYAGTDTMPSAQEIIETVDAIDAAQAGTIGKPVEQPDTEAKTITTVVQGAATVTTAADGTRVVSIPTTTTVVDSVTGKEISKATSVQTITYAPDAVIPADIQAQIDAAAESTTTTEETETEKTPPALSVPDIAAINLEPLLQAGSVLTGKFPISMISDITDFIDDLAASPVRPDFDLNLGNDMIIHVSFEWADQFAALFRAILGAAFIVLCVYEAVRLWV